MRTLSTALVLALLAATCPGSAARADVTHIVQPGHTLDAIARRYHVSVKAILAANHVTDPRSLKPGESLVIPGVDPPSKKDPGAIRASGGSAQHETAEASAHGQSTFASLERGQESRRRAAGDTIHAVHLGEEFRVRVKDGRGHVPASALSAFERMMREGEATHPIDARLVALVGIVSHHFGGRTLEVVSGYRPYSPTQYTAHSNHNTGRALDFRVAGVPNEALRDFCRTLRNAGCGYYPRSTFVHLDVREASAYWVDWARPGEPPRYDNSGPPDEQARGVSSPDPATSAPADDPGQDERNDHLDPGGSTETHGSAASEWPCK